MPERSLSCHILPGTQSSSLRWGPSVIEMTRWVKMLAPGLYSTTWPSFPWKERPDYSTKLFSDLTRGHGRHITSNSNNSHWHSKRLMQNFSKFSIGHWNTLRRRTAMLGPGLAQWWEPRASALHWIWDWPQVLTGYRNLVSWLQYLICFPIKWKE